jgi:hypothetical protein
MDKEMHILFDHFNKPISQIVIRNALGNFGAIYTATMRDIIRRSQQSITQNIFSENVAQIIVKFKMTRNGRFHGIEYIRGTVKDPNGKVSAFWSSISADAVSLKNYLLQQKVNHFNRTLVELSPNAKSKVRADLWKMFKKLFSICISDGSYGLVTASMILYAIFPEIALPIDYIQWKITFKTTNYGDITTLMTEEIIYWEGQTGQQLDSCDPTGNLTLASIYHVMAMKARP